LGASETGNDLEVQEYSYLAFGLRIASEIECDQLLPGSGEVDVRIRCGNVGGPLRSPTGQGVLYQNSSTQFLLNIDRVATYLVSGGNEIVVQPAPDADFDAIRLFLFGSVFGAILYQRGILPFHASAAVTPVGAVVFAGQSGCGKSTLACALHRKGYPILADDVCAVDTSGTMPMVMPANPFLMLWADALGGMGVDWQALRPARRELKKYILPLDDGFATGATRIHAIYILETSNSELSAPVSVKGLKKIEVLAGQMYKPHFVEDMPGGELLRQLSAIAGRVPIWRINLPRGQYRVTELVDLLERDFGA
jgi:hypothetical protein